MSITKAASPNPVVAGQELTYTLTVTNAGPSVAADTVVADPLPATTTFMAASAPAGWEITTPAVDGIVRFTHTAFAVGQATLTLRVLVDRDGGGGDQQHGQRHQPHRPGVPHRRHRRGEHHRGAGRRISPCRRTGRSGLPRVRRSPIVSP